MSQIIHQAKLISTTNPKFQYLIDTVGSLTVTSFALFEYNMLRNYLITSSILETKLDDTILTINTLNSTYVFQIME